MGLYDTTLGACLIGVFFNTFLYGLVTYQFAVYYRTKFNDTPAVKYTVLFLFVLDTFHSLSAVYLAWYYAIANYDNPEVLAVAIWPYPFTAIEIALTATVTQLYLGYRIWCLTNSRLLYGMVLVFAISSCVLGFVVGIWAWMIRVISELPRVTPSHITWITMTVILDTFITITLVIIFTYSRTGFRKTDTIINRLVRGAIQTALFASIFTLGFLITFVLLPSDQFYSMFAIPLGRIYTNTFLDTLLTRELLKEQMDGTDYAIGEPNSLNWSPADPTRTTSTTHQQP